MKLTFAVLAVAVTAVAAVQKTHLIPDQLSVQSEQAKRLLSQAQRVDEERGLQNNNNNNYEAPSWLTGYAVKFQGCFSIQQWNNNNDGSDVYIATKNLARFRLCPSTSCTASKAGGCSKAYGDYVVDMSTFINQFYEGMTQRIEYKCETQLNSCGCEGGDEDCSTSCFTTAGMTECIDVEEGNNFNIKDFLDCAAYNLQNDNNVQYYVGSYCGGQGGSIYLGVFTDDTCTTFADSNSGVTTWASLAGGIELPYNSTSLVGMDCLECVEPGDANMQNEQDQSDSDTVLDQCNQLYYLSGKCETYLPSETTSSPNEAGCNYISGINIARADGVISYSKARPNALATAAIVIFAMAFAAMGFYVYYLRTRLGVKQNRLL